MPGLDKTTSGASRVLAGAPGSTVRQAMKTSIERAVMAENICERGKQGAVRKRTLKILESFGGFRIEKTSDLLYGSAVPGITCAARSNV